jgi:glyoxylase-like metal-dependent hydrolase (beta-lactamase superfamily II)
MHFCVTDCAYASDGQRAACENSEQSTHECSKHARADSRVQGDSAVNDAGGQYNRSSALIEADGHRMLLDTGAHPDTVLQNAHDLKIDLSDVREVILTHNHWDHVSGLMTLRRSVFCEQV